MAKFVGFVGTIRGKVGTIVFTKGEKGLSYGRSYQPQVSNPKTIKQVDQRTKMNLVGRMSQVTPKSLLVGMSGENNRQRRSNFTRGLLNVATIDRSNPLSIIAKVAPENIVFSEGDEVLHATASEPTVTAKNVTLKLTLADASLAGAYGERVVVAVIKPEDKAGYSYVKYVDTVLDGESEKAVGIAFPQDLIDEAMVAIWRIPYILTSEAARYRAQAMATDGVDIIADMLRTNAKYVRGFGRSVFAAKSVFTKA